MALNLKVKKIIDERLNDELYASYHYKSAFAWAALKHYPGATKFFDQESKDEQQHANMLIEYATDYGYMPAYSDINTPPKSFSSLRDIIEQSLKLETDLMEKYEEAYKIALEVCPANAVALFEPLLLIQDSSVREYTNLIDDLNRYGDTPLGVSMFDKEVLGA